MLRALSEDPNGLALNIDPVLDLLRHPNDRHRHRALTYLKRLSPEALVPLAPEVINLLDDDSWYGNVRREAVATLRRLRIEDLLTLAPKVRTVCTHV